MNDDTTTSFQSIHDDQGAHGSLGIGVVRFPSGKKEYVYTDPNEIVMAWTVAEVPERIAYIEEQVGKGMHAAGYIAYEAAAAFDPALAAHAPGGIPILWFGLYNKYRIEDICERDLGRYALGEWAPQLEKAEYLEALAEIKEHIAAGDVYQVNYTFPMRAAFKGDALAWFRQLCRSQGGGLHSLMSMGRYAILSVSPELFFEWSAGRLVARPMKGTRPRGRYLEEDVLLAQALAESEKDRAENVMIVDMLRNDMGRVSEFGSVKVDSLFDIEQYNTVWQMTSTISSSCTASLPEVLNALFPAASITGAPKIMATHLIDALEPFRRGVYCGAVGWWRPGGARFNVGIRTVLLDMEKHIASYHVGSGITWDSDPDQEYEECCDKAVLLRRTFPDFELLETFRWEHGFAYLEEHLDRLENSAHYFNYRFDRDAIREQLFTYASDIPKGGHKVRALLARDGSLRMQHSGLKPPWKFRVALAPFAIRRNDIFLYHKTTMREVYVEARASRPDVDDVILWNEEGEITETTIANIVIEKDGRKMTPARDCGLLAGTFRQHLLDQKVIEEAVLQKDDLLNADKVFLINSVREWIEAEYIA